MIRSEAIPPAEFSSDTVKLDGNRVDIEDFMKAVPKILVTFFEGV